MDTRQIAYRFVPLMAAFALACSGVSEDSPTSPGVTSASGTAFASQVDRPAVTGPFASLYVGYRAGAPLERVSTVASGGVRSAVEYGGSRRTIILKVRVDSLSSITTRLRGLPWVASVARGNDSYRPEAITREPGLHGVSSRPFLSRASLVRSEISPWGIVDSRAEAVAGMLGVTGTGIKVGVLDTGIDCSLSDLSARVVGGKNFVSDSVDYCTDGIVNNGSGHGTSVASIIAASMDGSGLRGMAPTVDLYSFRICDSTCLGADIAAAFRWVVTTGMQVVNLSVGDCGPGSGVDTVVNNAIDDAVSAGVVVVAAAGNGEWKGCSSGSGVSLLASRPGVIAVTAVDTDYVVMPRGQYGSTVDLAAPSRVEALKNGGGTWNFGRTSSAAPHVSGAAALVLAAGWNSWNVSQLLTAEANPRDTTAGHPNIYFGYGVVDALAAAIPTPQVYSINDNCGAPWQDSGGPCAVSPVVSYGIRPFRYRWQITWSDNSHSPVDITTSDSTYSIGLTSAIYTVTVRVTVSDSTASRRRTGGPSEVGYVVCPGEAALWAPGQEGAKSKLKVTTRKSGEPPQTLSICS